MDKKVTVVKLSHRTLNLATTGVWLLTFMTMHLSEFRLGRTELYFVGPPRGLINFERITSLNRFWSWDTTLVRVFVDDIYKLEFVAFKSLPWSAFYWKELIVKPLGVGTAAEKGRNLVELGTPAEASAGLFAVPKSMIKDMRRASVVELRDEAGGAKPKAKVQPGGSGS